MKVLLTPEDIEAALESLGNVGAMDEAFVLVAARAYVELIRGNTVNGMQLVPTAARLVERLLPGEWCVQHDKPLVDFGTCALTELDGKPCQFEKVWDEGIVEVVARAIWDGMGFTRELKPVEGSPCFDAARAVLSAIAQLAETK